MRISAQKLFILWVFCRGHLLGNFRSQQAEANAKKSNFMFQLHADRSSNQVNVPRNASWKTAFRSMRFRRFQAVTAGVEAAAGEGAFAGLRIILFILQWTVCIPSVDHLSLSFLPPCGHQGGSDLWLWYAQSDDDSAVCFQEDGGSWDLSVAASISEAECFH